MVHASICVIFPLQNTLNVYIIAIMTNTQHISLTLKKYIEIHGDSAASKLLGFNKRTVASWRRGERKPSLKNAIKIINMNNQLSLEDCYIDKKD